MRYAVEATGTITGAEGLLDPDELQGVIDTIIDEVMKLKPLDSHVGATLAEGTFRMAVLVEADAEWDALHVGGGCLRTAFHAANVATPGWSVDDLHVSVGSEEELIDA